MTDTKRNADHADEVMREVLELLAEQDNLDHNWLIYLGEEDDKTPSDRAIAEFRREYGRRITERARSAN